MAYYWWYVYIFCYRRTFKVLVISGVKVTDVQAMVENHLKEMILKNFDPKKADTIFTEEGETPAWLTELIEHPTWRSLIYKLAEEYPDCLMLNFTIKVTKCQSKKLCS